MQRNGGKYRKYLTPRNVMNLVIGSMGVVLTLAASLTGSLTIVAGLKKSRERLRAVGAKYAWVAFAGMAISTFAMQRALITRDFSIKYVAEQGSSLTPPLYNVATMWSALEGSILLWGLVLAGYLAIVAKKFSNRLSDPMVSWALVTMFLVTAFFALLMLGPANPFQSFDPPVGYDGARAKPTFAKSYISSFPPPNSLPRLRRFHSTFCLCNSCTYNWEVRRRLATDHQALDFILMGMPHIWDNSWSLVGL